MTKHGIFFCALALAASPAFAGGNHADKDKSAGAGTTGAMGEQRSNQLPSFAALDDNGDGVISRQEFEQIGSGQSAAMGGGELGAGEETWKEKSEDAVLNQRDAEPDEAMGGGTTGTGEETWEEKAESAVLEQRAAEPTDDPAADSETWNEKAESAVLDQRAADPS